MSLMAKLLEAFEPNCTPKFMRDFMQLCTNYEANIV